MDISLIYKKMEPEVTARGCFITDVQKSRDNDIVIAVESEKGSVELDDCTALNEKFQELFSRDEEDYSLTVTSAGLDQPFKVLKQYLKAVGTDVTVRTKDGRKLTGILTGADENGFSLSYKAMESLPGRKRKEAVSREETFRFDAVNSVIPRIRID